MADLLLNLAREVYRRWGIEVDSHALDEAVMRGLLRLGSAHVKLRPILDSWLDRHAEAIAAHAHALWGDQARGLPALDHRGGGAALGSRLAALAPHAEVVHHARLQNAVGYFRYVRAALETTGPAGR